MFEKVCEFDNLYLSYLEAREGKRYRGPVLQFTYQLEDNLVEIQNELLNNTYRITNYTQFIITDPKRRLITALDFRDRVVQWAIYRQVYPIFEKRFIYHSYGCREEKGTHKAVAQLHNWLKAVDRKPEKYYYLKLDMSKFFYSVNREILLEIIKRRISDDRLINLLELIIASGDIQPVDGFAADAYPVNDSKVGLPIGNLTSQMFANIYLNELDQFVKNELHLHYYIRYMDDIIILGESKELLHQVKDRVEEFVNHKLGLRLNGKTAIRPISMGIEFVGYVVWPTHVKLRKATALKMKSNIKDKCWKLKNGQISADKLDATVGSYNGLMKHCNSYNLRCKLYEKYDLQQKGP